MSNIKFPNFDFDTWLMKFVYLYDNLEKENGFFEAKAEANFDHYTELKEHFYSQLHIDEENETWNYTIQYLEYVQKFTWFMRDMMQMHVLSLREIVFLIMDLKYPNRKMTRNIVGFLMNDKSYRIDNNLLFTPDVIKNVEYILNELQIKYEPK